MLNKTEEQLKEELKKEIEVEAKIRIKLAKLQAEDELLNETFKI